MNKERVSLLIGGFMCMGTIIGAIVFSLIAAGCFVVSYLYFHERGFLFNNAYIYASKQEREMMDKSPYFKQSGVVFTFLGIVFVINAVDIILRTSWLFYIVIGLAVITVIYAVVSTIMIEKENHIL